MASITEERAYAIAREIMTITSETFAQHENVIRTMHDSVQAQIASFGEAINAKKIEMDEIKDVIKQEHDAKSSEFKQLTGQCPRRSRIGQSGARGGH